VNVGAFLIGIALASAGMLVGAGGNAFTGILLVLAGFICILGGIKEW
jgi:hypothetical protein